VRQGASKSKGTKNQKQGRGQWLGARVVLYVYSLIIINKKNKNVTLELIF
jgi:hypothetical protein